MAISHRACISIGIRSRGNREIKAASKQKSRISWLPSKRRSDLPQRQPLEIPSQHFAATDRRPLSGTQNGALGRYALGHCEACEASFYCNESGTIDVDEFVTAVFGTEKWEAFATQHGGMDKREAARRRKELESFARKPLAGRRPRADSSDAR